MHSAASYYQEPEHNHHEEQALEDAYFSESEWNDDEQTEIRVYFEDENISGEKKVTSSIEREFFNMASIDSQRKWIDSHWDDFNIIYNY